MPTPIKLDKAAIVRGLTDGLIEATQETGDVVPEREVVEEYYKRKIEEHEESLVDHIIEYIVDLAFDDRREDNLPFELFEPKGEEVEIELADKEEEGNEDND